MSIKRILLLLALSAPTVLWSASPGVGADALIARLAKPAPTQVAFVEIRFSRMLRDPLIVSGELGYLGPDNLDRQVTAPYKELTTIRGESVNVEREGENPRSFGLRRAPELRGLLTGFSAILSGDAAALRQNFDLAMQGNQDAWRLMLSPSDDKAKRRLNSITITGRQNDPRCVIMKMGDGAFSVQLLGEETKIPVANDVMLLQLLGRCDAPSSLTAQ